MTRVGRMLAQAVPVLYGAVPLVGALVYVGLTDRPSPQLVAPLDVSGLLHAALVMAALLLGFRSDSLRGHTPRIIVAALAIFGLSAVMGTVLNAPEPMMVPLAMLLSGVHVLFALMLIYLIHRMGAAYRDRLVWAVPVGAVLYALLVAALFPTLSATPAYDWLNGPPGVFQVRLWGMLLAGAVAVAVLWTASRLTWWGCTMVLILCTALCFSGTRGAFASLAVALVLSQAVAPHRTARVLAVLVVGLGLGAALSLALPVPHSAYGLVNSLAETTQAADADALSAGRVELWQQTLGLIAERPLVGYGYDQLRYLATGRFEGFIQPHNSALQAVLSFGLVGGGALILILAWLWLRTVQTLRTHAEPARHAAFFGLNTLLAFSMLDGALYHEDTLMMVSILWAAALARPATPGGQGPARAL